MLKEKTMKNYAPNYSCETAEELFGESIHQCNNGDISVLWCTTAHINTSNRAYQREKVSTEKWKQDLMLTLLLHTFAGIPEIHIRVIKTEGGYRYELIDGQQRVTAITDFINGVYALPKLIVDGCDVSGMMVDELRDTYPKVYQRIIEYRISCKWYEDLSDKQTAHLFINVLNNVNGMKPQEIRNAILGFYSNYVRDTARGNKTEQSNPIDPHPLFERYTVNKKGVDKEYLKNFSTKFTLGGRMEVDEWLSTLLFFIHMGYRAGITHDTHKSWVEEIQSSNGVYAAKFKDKKSSDEKLNFALALMQSVPEEYKVKLNPMTSLMLVLYALECQNRGYNVVPERFSPSFFDTYVLWSDTSLKLYENKFTENGNQMPPFNELFGGKNSNAILTIFAVLDEDWSERGKKRCGLIKTDPRVSFSRADIEKKWQEQGGKCFYTGKPIAEDNLAGDHYIPRSLGVDEGGVTEYENLVVCSKRMNIKKSNMHGDDFVQMISLKDAA
jgi:hypothetical protein